MVIWLAAAWVIFRKKLRDFNKQEAKRARQSRLRRRREALLTRTYVKMKPSLQAQLLFVPLLDYIYAEAPVVAFLRAEIPADKDEATHDLEVLRATLLAVAKQHVQHERVAAIRGIVAAHLDIPMTQLSKKEDDYPTDVYDEAFFQKIPNRFDAGWGHPCTFPEQACRRRDIRRDLPQWRRATRHVLLAAGKEASSDLDEVNALGAAFAWQNGPEAIKDVRYTWRDMVSPYIVLGLGTIL